MNTVDNIVMIVMIAMLVIGILHIRSGRMSRDRFVLFSQRELKLVIGAVQS